MFVAWKLWRNADKGNYRDDDTATYHDSKKYTDTNIPIYGVSRTIVASSLYVWPEQITQLYGGEGPANTVDCLTLQILSTKTYNRRFLTNPTDKYARQRSGAPPSGSELHCTGLYICQLDFLGIANLIVFINRICNICVIPANSASNFAGPGINGCGSLQWPNNGKWRE